VLIYFKQRRKEAKTAKSFIYSRNAWDGKAERAERSGLPRFFFGYFLCSNDKESNNKKTELNQMHVNLLLFFFNKLLGLINAISIALIYFYK